MIPVTFVLSNPPEYSMEPFPQISFDFSKLTPADVQKAMASLNPAAVDAAISAINQEIKINNDRKLALAHIFNIVNIALRAASAF